MARSVGDAVDFKGDGGSARRGGGQLEVEAPGGLGPFDFATVTQQGDVSDFPSG